MNPKRGEIWWAALDPVVGSEIAKTRPCIIFTHDSLNQHRYTVVVVPLSSLKIARPPVTVTVKCMGKAAVAVVDQIRAVSKQRLKSKIGEANSAEMAAISDAVREVLDVI